MANNAIETGLKKMIDSHADMCIKADSDDWAVPLMLSLNNGKDIRFDLESIQDGLLTGRDGDGNFFQIPSTNITSYALTNGNGWEFGKS